MPLESGLNADRVTLMIFTWCASLVGTLGNLSIVGAVLVEKRLRFLGSAFVVNLAMADLIVTSYVFPIMGLNLLHEGSVLDELGCIVHGYLTGYSVLCSTTSFALIALDRYFCVCRSMDYKRIFTSRNVALMTLFSWLLPILLFLPATVFGIGYFSYDVQLDICCISFPSDHGWFGQILMGLGTQLPVVVCCVGYFQIAKAVWTSKRQVSVHQREAVNVASSCGGRNQQKAAQQDLALYRTLLTIFVLYLVCWTPYGICRVLLDTKSVSSIAEPCIRASALLALFNSVINSFVYGFTNKNFKRGYIVLLDVLLGPFCRMLPITWRVKVTPEASIVMPQPTNMTEVD